MVIAKDHICYWSGFSFAICVDKLFNIKLYALEMLER